MKPTIIFVDDEQNVREGIKRMLRHKPYRVLTLESAQQCVDVLAVTDVQILVTDLNMPGLNGQTLINYFKANKPETIRIVLSGKLTLENTLELVNNGEVFRCLEKPCPAAVLLQAINCAMSLWSEKKVNRIAKNTNSPLPQSIEPRPSNSTSLIRDALNDVERLEKSLKSYSDRGSPNLTE